MGVKLMKSEANFAIHLDGESTIDAGLLSDIIKNIAELTKLAAQQEDSNAYLKMNVTAFQNGSFQIDFSSVCEVAANVFSSIIAHSDLALNVVKAVREFFEIKKLLKGNLPRSVSEDENAQVTITAHDGNSICVSKTGASIVNNIKIDQLTVNISNDVIEHNPKGGFSFKTKQNEMYCSAEDLGNISKSLPISEEIPCLKTRCTAVFPIKSVDLLGHSQWGFIYKDRVIKAIVLDEEFIDKVHNGEIIKAGDMLKVTLEVYVDLDCFGKPIESSKKYTVLKVHGDIIRPDDGCQLEWE